MSWMNIKGLFSRLFRGGASGQLHVTIEELILRFDDLSTWLEDHTQRLNAIEKQVEATRKKVYRDEEGTEAEKVIAQGNQQRTNPFTELRGGEPIPPQYMNIFGG